MIPPARHHFLLDETVTYLNHGSFGATPHPVLEHQRALQLELEREPVQFLYHTLEQRLRDVRTWLSSMFHGDADDYALVSNATTGVNTVLKSLKLEPGDEMVTTSQGYNACTNAMRSVAQRSGATVKVAPVKFPLFSSQDVVDAIAAQMTPRTRLVLVDHVTSPTALIFPVEEVVRLCHRHGVLCLVDGAHAPAMVSFNLEALDADFYTGNLHKWMCAPKGAAFLHVQKRHQSWVEPLVVSHGANSARTDVSRFRLNFDWTGTADATAVLSAPEAHRFLESVDAGGLASIMTNNAAMIERAGQLLSSVLGQTERVPAVLRGSMESMRLPPLPSGQSFEPTGGDPLQRWLFETKRIEVPIFYCDNVRLIRISAHCYNAFSDYQALADALVEARQRGFLT
jgi:isopenicillin-N epimerase